MTRSKAYEIAIISLMQFDDARYSADEKNEAIKILLDRLEIEKLIEKAAEEREENK